MGKVIQPQRLRGKVRKPWAKGKSDKDKTIGAVMTVLTRQGMTLCFSGRLSLPEEGITTRQAFVEMNKSGDEEGGWKDGKLAWEICSPL